MSQAHPSSYIHGALSVLESAFTRMRIKGLALWTGIIRDEQLKQDEVRSEISSECLQLETLIMEYSKDKVFTEFERDDLIRKIQELGRENATGVVEKGFGDA